MTPLSFFFLGLPVALAVVVLTALHRMRPGAARVPLVATVTWFGVVFALVQSGFMAQFDRLPPHVPMVVFGAVLVSLLVAQTRAVREALEAMPDWWPVALQAFRFPVELGLYAGWKAGLVPEQMTFHGRNFDVLVGLGAPVMAWLIAHRRVSRGMQVAWQLGSVALLVNVVSIAITSAPGPLHASWPGEPLTSIGQWPYALLPGFLVPMAVVGHLAAAWKLRRPQLRAAEA